MTTDLKILQDLSAYRPVHCYKGECFTSTDSPVLMILLTPVENVPAQATHTALIPKPCSHASSAAHERGFPLLYV
jgi:hypothetical protein